MADDENNPDAIYTLDLDTSKVNKKAEETLKIIQGVMDKANNLINVSNSATESSAKKSKSAIETSTSKTVSDIVKKTKVIRDTISGVTKQSDETSKSIADIGKQIDNINKKVIKPASIDTGGIDETLSSISKISDKSSESIASISEHIDDLNKKVIKPITVDVQSKFNPGQDNFKVELPDNLEGILLENQRSSTISIVSQIREGLSKGEKFGIANTGLQEQSQYAKELQDLISSIDGVIDTLNSRETGDSVSDINNIIKDKIVPTILRINDLDTADSSQIQEAIDLVQSLSRQMSGYRPQVDQPAGETVQDPIRINMPVFNLPEGQNEIIDTFRTASELVTRLNLDILGFRDTVDGDLGNSLTGVSTKLADLSERESFLADLLNTIPVDDAEAFNTLSKQLGVYIEELKEIETFDIRDPIGEANINDSLDRVIKSMDLLTLRVVQDLAEIQDTGKNAQIRIFDPSKVDADFETLNVAKQFLQDHADAMQDLREEGILSVPIVPFDISGLAELAAQFRELTSGVLDDAQSINDYIPFSDDSWASAAKDQVDKLHEILGSAQESIGELLTLYQDLDPGQLVDFDFSSGVAEVNKYFAAITKQRNGINNLINTAKKAGVSTGLASGGIRAVTQNTIAFEKSMASLGGITEKCTKAFGGFDTIVSKMRRDIDGGGNSLTNIRDAIDSSATAAVTAADYVANLTAGMTRMAHAGVNQIVSEDQAIRRLQGRMASGDAESMVNDIMANDKKGLLTRAEAAQMAMQYAEAGGVPANIANMMTAARKASFAKGTDWEQAMSDFANVVKSDQFKDKNLQDTYGIYEVQYRQATYDAANRMGFDYADQTDPLKAMEARAAGLEQLISDKFGAIDDSMMSPAETMKALSTSMENLKGTFVKELMPGIQAVVGVVTAFMKLFSILPGPVKMVIGVMILLGAALGTVASQISGMISTFQIVLPKILGDTAATELNTVSKVKNAVAGRMSIAGMKELIGMIWARVTAMGAETASIIRNTVAKYANVEATTLDTLATKANARAGLQSAGGDVLKSLKEITSLTWMKTAATTASTMATGGLATVQAVATGAMGLFSGATFAAAGAAWALLAPLLPIIIAVGLVAAGLYVLLGGMDGINEKATAAGKALSDFGQWVMTSLQPVIGFLSEVWEAISTFIEGIGLVAGSLMAGVFEGIFTGIMAVVSPLIEALSSLMSIFSDLGQIMGFTFEDEESKEFFKMVADGARMLGRAIGFLISIPLMPLIMILTGVAKIVKWVADELKSGKDQIKPWVDAFKTLQVVVSAVMNPLGFILSALGMMKKTDGKAATPLDALKVVITAVVDGLKSITKMFADLAKGGTDIADRIVAPFKGILDGMNALMDNPFTKLFITPAAADTTIPQPVETPQAVIDPNAEAIAAQKNKQQQEMLDASKRASISREIYNASYDELSDSERRNVDSKVESSRMYDPVIKPQSAIATAQQVAQSVPDQVRQAQSVVPDIEFVPPTVREAITTVQPVITPTVQDVFVTKTETSTSPLLTVGREGTSGSVGVTGVNTAQESFSGVSRGSGNVSVMIQSPSFPISISSNELAHAITNKQINMDEVANRIAEMAVDKLSERISNEIFTWGA